MPRGIFEEDPEGTAGWNTWRNPEWMSGWATEEIVGEDALGMPEE